MSGISLFSSALARGGKEREGEPGKERGSAGHKRRREGDRDGESKGMVHGIGERKKMRRRESGGKGGREEVKETSTSAVVSPFLTPSRDPLEESPIDAQAHSMTHSVCLAEEASDDSEEEKTYLEQATFASLGLDSWLVSACEEMGFSHPTRVQRKCVPPVLEGRSCIASAETGSGKTAAFALPILHHLAKDPFGPFALVLTPTRELAMQISEQFRALGAPMRLRDSCVIGGVDMVRQALELEKKPHVIVATPGRLLDQMRTNGISLHRIRFLVLDEADRLLSGTLADEVEEVLELLPDPSTRQTLLFSATLSPAFTAFTKGADAPYCFHQSSKLYATVKTLRQQYIFLASQAKDCYLEYLLQEHEDKSVIVFTSTCRSAALLTLALKELEIASTCLHSQLTQAERVKALTAFKSRYVKVLIATDVASRGLDIPSVQLVINYDIPRSSEDYVHRVGRTARAGRNGISLSLVTEHDVELVLNIEKVIGKKLELCEVDEDEVLLHLNEAKAAVALANAALHEMGFEEKHQSRKKGRRVAQEREKGSDKKGKQRQAKKKARK